MFTRRPRSYQVTVAQRACVHAAATYLLFSSCRCFRLCLVCLLCIFSFPLRLSSSLPRLCLCLHGLQATDLAVQASLASASSAASATYLLLCLCTASTMPYACASSSARSPVVRCFAVLPYLRRPVARALLSPLPPLICGAFQTMMHWSKHYLVLRRGHNCQNPNKTCSLA